MSECPGLLGYADSSVDRSGAIHVRVVSNMACPRRLAGTGDWSKHAFLDARSAHKSPASLPIRPQALICDHCARARLEPQFGPSGPKSCENPRPAVIPLVRACSAGSPIYRELIHDPGAMIEGIRDCFRDPATRRVRSLRNRTQQRDSVH